MASLREENLVYRLANRDPNTPMTEAIMAMIVLLGGKPLKMTDPYVDLYVRLAQAVWQKHIEGVELEVPVPHVPYLDN